MGDLWVGFEVIGLGRLEVVPVRVKSEFFWRGHFASIVTKEGAGFGTRFFL